MIYESAITSIAHSLYRSISMHFPARKHPTRALVSTTDGQMPAQTYIHHTSCIPSVSEKLKQYQHTHVKLSKLRSSSSLTYCTSSRMSSSDHLRVERFLENGRSCATSIAGRLSEGAFVIKFFENISIDHARREKTCAYTESGNNNTNDFLFHGSLCHCDQQGYDVVFPSKL